MKLLSKLKVFYTKEDFNYSEEDVNPFKFHKTFYLTLSAFRVTDIENKMKPKFFNHNLYIFLIELTGLMIFCITLGHALYDLEIAYLTEVVCYTFLLIYMMLILYCAGFHAPQYHHLLRAMKEDFEYVCTTGQKYKEKFFANQIITWKLCILNCGFLFSVAGGMSLFSFLSLFYYLITHKDTDEGKRPLLWPYWIGDIDFSVTPYFEIAFTIGNLCILFYGHGYSFMLQTQILWVRHMASQADIIIWLLQDLLTDVYPTRNRHEKARFAHLIQHRLRDIVIKHQSMFSLLDSYATVYKKLLTFEQIMCGPLACFTAYCVVEKFSEGEFKTLLALLFLADVVFYFIPSYLCTFLYLKIQSICDACWDTPFWNADPFIRPYLVLIMQRSRRPLPLQTPGFQEISLETFSKKMASAYSLFNMLRNLDLKF